MNQFQETTIPLAFKLIEKGDIQTGLQILKTNSKIFLQEDFNEFLKLIPDLLNSKDENILSDSLEIACNMVFVPNQNSLKIFSEILSQHKNLFKNTHLLILKLEIIMKLFVRSEIFTFQFLPLVMKCCDDIDSRIQRIISEILEVYCSLSWGNILKITEFNCLDYLVFQYQTTTSTILEKVYFLRKDWRILIEKKLENFIKNGSTSNCKIFPYVQKTFNFTDKEICCEFYEKLDDSKIRKYDFLIDECMDECNGDYYHLGMGCLTVFSPCKTISIPIIGSPKKFKIFGEFISILNNSEGYCIYNIQSLIQIGKPIYTIPSFFGSFLHFFQVDQMMCHMSLLHEKTLFLVFFDMNGSHLHSNTIQCESKIIDGCVNNNGTEFYLLTPKSIKLLKFDKRSFKMSSLFNISIWRPKKISISSRNLISISGNQEIQIIDTLGILQYNYKFYGRFEVFQEFSNVDPTIFFFFDDFSLKIFHLNKHGKSKDLSKQLIQIIPLRMVGKFSRLFFQTVNGKHLCFGNLWNGISRYNLKQIKPDLITQKSFDIYFQFN
jgi:hypothetical protein